MNDKIKITGHINHGKTTLTESIMKVIDETGAPIANTINVNGECYQEKESYTFSGNGKLGSIRKLLASMAYMYGEKSYERKFPAVNIVKEYELIQLKKSDLCRAHRQHIEYVFNKHYKKV